MGQPLQATVFSGGSLTPIPINMFAQPSEGAKSVPLVIIWKNYPKQLNPDTNLLVSTVSIDLALQQTGGTISQLGGVFYDNTHCSVGVSIYVPDTQTWYGIPAGSSGYIPFVTGQLKFTVQTLDAPLPADVTNIAALNVYTAPADVGLFVAPQHVIVDNVSVPVIVRFNVPQAVVFNSPPIVLSPDQITTIKLASNLPAPGGGAVFTSLFLGNGWITAIDLEISGAAVTVATSILHIHIQTQSGVNIYVKDVELFTTATPNVSSERKVINLAGLNIKSTDGATIFVSVDANGGGVSAGIYSGTVVYHT